MALASARLTPQRATSLLNDTLPCKANAGSVFFVGALCATDADGYLVPGATATTLTAAGVFCNQPDRVPAQSYTAASPDGTDTFIVKRGTFKFNNSGTDPVTQASMNKVCYIVDDETVAATNGTNTRSVAGLVRGIDDDTSPTGAGVWVEVGPPV